MSGMRVYIRKADIQGGERRDPQACPLALALRRQFPRAEVGTRAWEPGGDGAEYKNHASARRFVIAFDHGEIVQPGYVTVEAPR